LNTDAVSFLVQERYTRAGTISFRHMQEPAADHFVYDQGILVVKWGGK